MKKQLLALLFIPFLLAGCNGESYKSVTVTVPESSGVLGAFNLTGPEDGFVTNKGFTFTWEASTNADSYSIEISADASFYHDKDSIYVKENNISQTQYDLNYTLPKKDIIYFWRVTAHNEDYDKFSNQVGNFFYESTKIGELPIEIEDAQDWAVHKEGSQATVSIDRSNFFGNGKNSLSIVFDKEHTSQGIPKSDGWIVITKTEDRELYGTDSFYMNFYYSGHDATVLIRVLDYDGEYWHNQVQISNNSKQTILMKYSDFSLRTAGTNIYNRVFDWEHIRYFEIVFERTFGDGVCMLSDIKAVNYEDYSHLFMQKMDFRRDDMSEWTYENYDFAKSISEDGSEITLGYTAKNAETNPDGFSGYGFQNINLYKFFVRGDALRMKVKFTGAGSSAMFYFRVLEEDKDRWQFKVPFSYFTRDEYTELIIPLKAFQRTDYMSGDGAKQFYFVQKFNVGLADNYSTGSISIKDLEIINLVPDVVETNVRTLTENGCIENFNDYNIYTEIYYFWEQGTVNKDEAMKLDNIHRAGGYRNSYCAEFDYKADMEAAQYGINLDASAVKDKTAFQMWIKDASKKPDDPAISYLSDDDVAAQLTIQLTLDSGEIYRYTINRLRKEWSIYTVAFTDFELVNRASLIDEPQPLTSEHIIHLGFGFQYFYYDQSGKSHPTYAIANPVYLDEMFFVTSHESTVEEMTSSAIDTDEDGITRIDSFENYETSEEVFDSWRYATDLEYNGMELSEDVSSIGDKKSLRMKYQGSTSVSYERATPFAKTAKAYGFSMDIKTLNENAEIYINLNIRIGNNLYKLRYTLNKSKYPNPSDISGWYHLEIGYSLFKDITTSQGTTTISRDDTPSIETISFGIVNKVDDEPAASYIFIDNMRLLPQVKKSENPDRPFGYATERIEKIEEAK